MAVGSSSRRAVRRDAIRNIKVNVRYARERLEPTNYVPVGTTREVLDWVGSSPMKAKRALARELAMESPRLKLVQELHPIAMQE